MNRIRLALAAAAIAVLAAGAALASAQTGGRIGLDVRVWRSADDHERIFVSARAEGGSWGDLGTLPVDFDHTTANARFDYSDFALVASASRAFTGLSTRCEVWLDYVASSSYKIGVVDTYTASDHECRQINEFTGRARDELDSAWDDGYEQGKKDAQPARAASIRCVFDDGATVHTATQDQCNYLKLKIDGNDRPEWWNADPPAQTCDIRDSARTVAAATVRVSTSSAAGTAFHVGGGRFITAYHVVEGADTVTLRGDGWSQTASVEYYWARTERPNRYGEPVGTLDIAVLQAYGRPARGFAYDWDSAPALTPDDAFAVGDAVGIVGFPGRVAQDTGRSSTAFGSMTAYRPDFNNLLGIDAYLGAGASGSPIFDECGNVIAVKISFSPTGDGVHGTVIINHDVWHEYIWDW